MKHNNMTHNNMKHMGMKLIGATAICALMLPTSALALDARDFADKMTATISALASITLTVSDAVVEGDNVVLSGWTLSDVQGKDGDSKLLETSVTFTNVIETENGGYTADQALFENLDIDKDGIHLVVSDVSVDGIQLHENSATDVLQMMHLYSGIQTGPINVALEGTDVFKVDSMSLTADWNEDDSVMQSDYLISGIYGDLTQVDDHEAQAFFAMLGLTNLNATMEGKSTWTVEGGIISVPQSSITIDDVGRLNIGLDLHGYTIALIETIQSMSKEMAALGPNSDEYEAKSMQLLMGMAADLSFASLSIRFDDDSVTDKLLDYFANDAGMSRKGLISTIGQILPAMLGAMEIPELQDEISDAVMEYLLAPESLEIKAEPAEPVPFMALAAVAQNPSIAKSLLNISITANQPE